MKIEKFKETLIAFDNEKELINATDMIRCYPNKRISDYLRLKQTNELKTALESKTGNPVLVVKHGGTGHGTWMTKLMALDFAAWLDVEFRIFIYETFEQAVKDKMRNMQIMLDYYGDLDDINDLYNR